MSTLCRTILNYAMIWKPRIWIYFVVWVTHSKHVIAWVAAVLSLLVYLALNFIIILNVLRWNCSNQWWYLDFLDPIRKTNKPVLADEHVSFRFLFVIFFHFRFRFWWCNNFLQIRIRWCMNLNCNTQCICQQTKTTSFIRKETEVNMVTLCYTYFHLFISRTQQCGLIWTIVLTHITKKIFDTFNEESIYHQTWKCLIHSLKIANDAQKLLSIEQLNAEHDVLRWILHATIVPTFVCLFEDWDIFNTTINWHQLRVEQYKSIWSDFYCPSSLK